MDDMSRGKRWLSLHIYSHCPLSLVDLRTMQSFPQNHGRPRTSNRPNRLHPNFLRSWRNSCPRNHAHAKLSHQGKQICSKSTCFRSSKRHHSDQIERVMTRAQIQYPTEWSYLECIAVDKSLSSSLHFSWSSTIRSGRQIHQWGLWPLSIRGVSGRWFAFD
jgi:hypothetical protein